MNIREHGAYATKRITVTLERNTVQFTFPKTHFTDAQCDTFSLQCTKYTTIKPSGATNTAKQTLTIIIVNNESALSLFLPGQTFLPHLSLSFLISLYNNYQHGDLMKICSRTNRREVKCNQNV